MLVVNSGSVRESPCVRHWLWQHESCGTEGVMEKSRGLALGGRVGSTEEKPAGGIDESAASAAMETQHVVDAKTI